MAKANSKAAPVKETPAALAVRYFTNLTQDPKSVELAGYLDGVRGGGRKALDEFGDALQGSLHGLVLKAKAQNTEPPLLEDDMDGSLFKLTCYATFLASYAQLRDEASSSAMDGEDAGRHYACMMLRDALTALHERVLQERIGAQQEGGAA